jgi:predicted Zn finger-like uncharacterized protein
MPSRILCPGCQAAFAYSPALLGKTVRCKTCQHTFTITAPPPEEAATAPATAPQKAPAASPATPVAKTPAPVARTPAPPPLPPRAAADKGSKSGEPSKASGSRPGVSSAKPPETGSKSGATRRPDPDDDRPRVGRDDDRDDDDRDDDDRPSRRKDAPRRRPAPAPERESGGPLLLIGLIAAFVVGFLILAAGIAFLLWPSSTPSTSGQVTPAAPAGDGVAAVEPPKNLDAILNDAPNRGEGVVAGPPPVGAPPLPNFELPNFEPPAAKRPPRGGAPRLPRIDNAPAFPGRPPVAPKAALPAPKFAPVVPLPITATPLATGRVERAMPGSIENMVVAGGGRLLLLHLPAARRVAVFDVSKGERVKLIPAEDPGALVAGGMNLFVIYLPDKGVLERYNCQTLEREAELKDVFPAEVKALAMGCASNGPLVAALGGARRTVHGGATFGYFDPATGKEVGYEVAGADNPFGLGIHNAQPFVRVSADGSLVVGWGENGQGGTQTDVLTGGRIARHWQFHWLDAVLPSADGRTLYGKGTRYPPDMKKDERFREDHDNPVWLIPAVHGDAYLSLRGAPAERRGMPAPRPAVLEVCLGTEGKSILKLTNVANVEVPAGFFESRGKAFDRHLVLVPDARVLAVVPTKSRDRLVLYRADLDAALAKADFDFLFVSSRAPTAAVKGQTYQYTLAVKSKKGGVKVSLESGPKGLTVTPAGAVTWDVPNNYSDPEAGVILLVKDQGGQEVFHSFRLSVRDRDGTAADPKRK